MGLLLLAALSWAGDTLTPSPPGLPVPGECHQSFAVEAGLPVSSDVVEGLCVARCGGVLVPTSDTAYLLSVEAENALHLADIELLKIQRQDLRARIKDAERPWVSRLIGGAVGVTLGVGVGLTVGAYYTGRGGAR